ncbi:MAG: class A beta-lactamase-related serine hydrolase [Rhizobium sp.]|nr:MAG: class A beta-lactamase-related serine hydrolase [Rhizobium sp.]
MPVFENLPQRDALAERIDALFRERVGQKATPGIRFAVFDRTGIVFEGGHGSAGTAGSPPASHTRFRIASCTKSFTAAAVLILRDRGQLSLDNPVTHYVPALKPTLPKGRPEAPTVRMLLSMAGGLPTDDPWADRQESLSNAAFMAVIEKGVRFATAPGTRYEYSNLGYALLGQVIEAVSGERYVDFVANHLLAPLGLLETGFDPLSVAPERMAIGYRPVDGDWSALPFTGPGAFSAIGGAVTTTHDLARWASWLGDAFNPTSADMGPLSASSRREMQRIQCAMTPEPTENASLKGYGFGLVVEQNSRFGPVISHSGGYPGFSSHMRWNAHTGFGVVAFENATYSGAWTPTTAALDLLLDAASASDGSAEEAPSVIRELSAGLLQLLTKGWDDAVADTIFLENVDMDRPYRERAAELAALREKAGALAPAEPKILPRDPGGADGGFGRFELRLPCAAGEIVANVLCGPPEPLRIQSVTWRL